MEDPFGPPEADTAGRRLMKIGRLMMTVVLIAQTVSGFMLDWSGNHLLSPLWHPHARFHGALLLFFLSGASATGLWLLWRDSREPRVALTAAALISLSFWTPFFYATMLLPGSTLWAGDPAAVPHLAGHVFYPNVAVAGLFAVMIAAAWTLGSGDPEWLSHAGGAASSRAASPGPMGRS
jgi:hypothetical protein